MPEILIALGSNLGDRGGYLAKAIQKLEPEIHLLSESSIYETEPWGHKEQDPFLNQVIRAETALLPHAVLRKLKSIESELGREKTIRYGPRVIDLDLLFYDNLVLSTEALKIPHPQLAKRAFVLIPLKEIAPDFVHPQFDQTIRQLSQKISDKGVRKYAGRSK